MLPVTLTVIVQAAPAAKLAPLKLTVDDPAVAVAVPPQEFVRPGVAATTKPAGRLSVNAIPVSVVAVLGFVMEKLSVVLLPVKIGFAVNAFWITGGAMTVNDETP